MSITCTEIIKLLESNGWFFVRQKGSHKIFKKEGERLTIVVPDHGNKDLPKGTAMSILKAAGLK